MEDAILIKECKKGNINAYGKLVNKYMKRAYNVALYFTKDPNDAWDISQEGFLNAWKGIKRFDTRRAFFPWLYTIIKNESLKKFRRERKEMNLNQIPISIIESPLKRLEEMEKIEKLRKAILKLDKEKQEIIYLRHFAEMSYKEIAESLNLSPGTVMSRLYYARKALLQEYKNG